MKRFFSAFFRSFFIYLFILLVSSPLVINGVALDDLIAQAKEQQNG